MTRHDQEFLFAYDISDDHERRRVEKLLLGYGFRRQRSVFICRLTRSQCEKLRGLLTALNLQTGFVLVIRIAHGSDIETIGTCTLPDQDNDYAFII